MDDPEGERERLCLTELLIAVDEKHVFEILIFSRIHDI